MIVLAVEGIRKHYGPEPVLDGVTFDVRPGQRIGLVGPNGTGKTTLLRILAGRDDPDAGTCQLHPSLRLGYLEQQPVFDQDRTLWDEAYSALEHLVAIQHEALAVAEALAHTADESDRRRLTARYDHLQQELHRHDAYNLEYKVERVLDGLRFPRSSFRQPMLSLSGGEQNRLMLAKLLLAEPDVMLLDEPSNHLDIAATEWLEEFLAGNSAAMVVVSHDRYFLDRVTTHTLELFRGTVESYVGNFSAYWQQKDERLLVSRRTYERQQTEIAKTEDFIRRNHYGQKHAQAEDRRKKLARIERVAPPREIAEPPMRFFCAERSGDIVLRAEELGKSFDRPLFVNVTFDILRGQRWGLLGPNGSGKTTLLRCLLGQIAPDAGRIDVGHAVEVGYFDQQLAGLDQATPVMDAIRPPRKDFVEQQRRDLLARFGLTGDTALQPVGQLSGGERCRAALARLAAMDANFLVLDEPTNHLDLWARDALEKALREFEGTVLFVSHDRYFVDRVADHLVMIEPDRVRTIEGNYRTYLELLEASAGDPEARESSSGDGKPAKAARPGNANSDSPPAKKRRFAYRKTADIEQEIAHREQRIKDIHEQLALPETHRDGNLVRQLKNEIAEHNEALPQLYEHWEQAAELNW
jgi:ATP-binding cassette subfamily F protein 3